MEWLHSFPDDGNSFVVCVLCSYCRYHWYIYIPMLQLILSKKLGPKGIVSVEGREGIMNR